MDGVNTGSLIFGQVEHQAGSADHTTYWDESTIHKTLVKNHFLIGPANEATQFVWVNNGDGKQTAK